MADEKPNSATGPKVSPARTVSSLILLLVVGVVCAIELRAGLGQMISGKSLAAKSKDGEFTDLTLADARNLLSMSPKETTENRGPDTYYHYEWYSLLRPLMGQQSPKLTIVASNDENPQALAYFASDEPEEVPAPSSDGGDSVTPPTMMGGPGMGGPGMMSGPGMGAPGMGPGPEGEGATNSRPPLEEDEGSSDIKPATDTDKPSEPNAPEETPAESPAPAETPAPSDAPASTR